MGLLTPAPAQALWGRGWLERLSGPGPFGGNMYGSRVLCLSRPRGTDNVDATRDNIERHGFASQFLSSREPDKRIYFSLFGCNFLDRNEPRLEIGWQLATLRSKENLLKYGPSAPSNRDVNVRMLLVTGDIRVNRVLDVGAGWGTARFSAEDDALFRPFDYKVSQPLRLTTRPLATFLDRRAWEFVTVRFDATKIHGVFTDTQFGAQPGTYSEAGELVWNWAIIVDVGAML